jgi:PAS domain S-box-containing protein
MVAWDWFFYGAFLRPGWSPAEVTWTAMALLGLVLNLFALYDAQGDLYLLRSRRMNGARELVARGHRRNAIVRGLVKFGFSIIGFAALGTPPSPRRSPTLPVLVLVLVLAIIGLTYTDVRERVDRHALLRLLAARLPGDEGEGEVTIDRESRIVAASRGAATALGYAPGALIGQTLAAVFTFEEYRAHRDAFARYLATGESDTLGRPRYVIGLREDGEPVPLEATFVEEGFGDARRWAVHLRRSGSPLLEGA